MKEDLTGVDFGRSIDSSVIEQGLRELNPDIHFDMGADLGMWHPRIDSRQGVFYRGNHICSMDRGMVPEFKIWTVKEEVVEVPWSDYDKEGVSIQYRVIAPSEPNYIENFMKAIKGNDPEWQTLGDGKLIRSFCLQVRKVRGRCLRVGWRHTFHRVAGYGIPHVTKESIAAKFHVDMNVMLVGSPDEIAQAILEE